MKVSILCLGNIAAKMAQTLNALPEAEPYAVASRTASKATAFAAEHGFQKAYGSYEELAADPNAGLIYIASPHSHHYKLAKLCLEHGHPVICEKPFTANRAQAEELFALAAQKNLFITEAMWTRYLPYIDKVREILASGAIGEICSASATFGCPLSHVERMARPELAGGALLDLGVYPFTFLSLFMESDIASIATEAVKTTLGVDAQSTTVLRYRNGTLGTVQCSMLNHMPVYASIYGTKGRIEVPNFMSAERFTLYIDGQSPDEYRFPFEVNGFEYEIRAAFAALAEGRTTCPQSPHAETLRVIGLMDTLRARWGVRFPFET